MDLKIVIFIIIIFIFTGCKYLNNTNYRFRRTQKPVFSFAAFVIGPPYVCTIQRFL